MILKKVKSYFLLKVLKEETYNHKCDVYSFGMTAWSIDAEAIPFTDVNDFKILKERVISGARPSLNPKCKMNDIIQRCWDNVFLLFYVCYFAFYLFFIDDAHFYFFRTRKIVPISMKLWNSV